jgi:hypothetical protein
LGKDYILEAFDNSFDNQVLLSHLTHDSMKLIYEESFATVKEKIMDILKLLNIKEEYNEKFLIRFRLLFQEHFSSIFICSSKNIENIKDKMKRVVNAYKENSEGIISDLDSKGFKNFITYSFNLCIYMVLHDPVLCFNIQPYEKRNLSYYFYTKSEFINIDGFAKEQQPCIVIVSPPMLRSNNIYQGIKPAVLIVSNPSEAVMTECEKNSNSSKARSHSTSDILTMQSPAILAESIEKTGDTKSI